MPYILKATRPLVESGLVKSAGDLDYYITMACLRFLKDQGQCFDTFAKIDGVLGLVQDEFRRRKIHPYEDVKITENGDVFT